MDQSKKEIKQLFKKENLYTEEIQKFIDKEAIVESFKPNGEIESVMGIIRGMNLNFGNVVIMTPQEKILIKQFYRIRRKRGN